VRWRVGRVGRGAQGAGRRAQGTGHRAQGTGHRAQGTGHRAQGRGFAPLRPGLPNRTAATRNSRGRMGPTQEVSEGGKCVVSIRL